MSQTEAIYHHMKSGRSITSIEALEEYGCFRLGARIQELKAAGISIRSEMVRVGEKRVARYSLRSKRLLEVRL